MNVDELKVEVAKLSAEDRLELAEWIFRADEILDLQRSNLIRDIQHGIDQADRGELIDGEVVFKRMHERWPGLE